MSHATLSCSIVPLSHIGLNPCVFACPPRTVRPDGLRDGLRDCRLGSKVFGVPDLTRRRPVSHQSHRHGRD